MAEHNIPMMLKLYDDDLGMYTLLFDRDTSSFSIGGRDISIDSPELFSETLFPTGTSISFEELLDSPAYIGIRGNPIATPKFFNWLQEYCNKEDLEQTRQTIINVYEELRGISLDKVLDTHEVLYGFSANLLRPGHLNLTTLGSYACLEVSVYGVFIDNHEWDTGFAEYEFHNIDMPAQRISLLAGMGHLALRASS
jgi:hypothetical protein